jgi:hypothetical protein
MRKLENIVCSHVHPDKIYPNIIKLLWDCQRLHCNSNWISRKKKKNVIINLIDDDQNKLMKCG